MLIRNSSKYIKKIKIYLIFIIAVLFICIIGTKVYAQEVTKTVYKTLPGSKFWIKGTSTINDFTCSTQKIVGYGSLSNSLDSLKEDTEKTRLDTDKVVIWIPVKSFDCGRNALNNDMYHAMKSDKYPEIYYVLTSAKLITPYDSTDSTFVLESIGKLTISGKTNTVNIKINIHKLPNDELKLTGSLPISMHDYGIIPPTAFWGLIRAHDKLIIDFYLLVKAEKNRNNRNPDETVTKNVRK